MTIELTEDTIRKLDAPARGNRITYDAKVSGFGCRITASGARSFVLNYRTRSGLERRYTIGAWPEWKVATARKEAADLKLQIRANGFDPLGQLQSEREAQTVAELCKDFVADVLPSRRESTRREYIAIIDTIVLPAWGRRKVADITADDVDALHRRITRAGPSGRPAPYRANRAVAVLSKLFALAVRSKIRGDNPCKGVARNDEVKRQRFLSSIEVKALIAALAAHDDRDAADALELLLLTGARRGEVLTARWADIDLAVGVWTKPGATTKSKTEHRVPLSAAAVDVLKRIKARRAARRIKTANDRRIVKSEFVFPGRDDGHRKELKKDWRAICIAAGIVVIKQSKGPDGEPLAKIEPGARIHDLRHSFASHLVSTGASLPIVGALLGHTQPATTARYAHLLDDPLRAAAEKVAAIVAEAAT